MSMLIQNWFGIFMKKHLAKVKSFGCKILRLDAFAYLHKEVGQSNFFNKPGTWHHLERINQIAEKNNLNSFTRNSCRIWITFTR